MHEKRCPVGLAVQFLIVVVIALFCNAQLSSCCRIKGGESEEIKIPRAPPRISADRLSDHIIKSLKL